MNNNGHDEALAAAIEGERAYQEKMFAQVVRELALSKDPTWLYDHRHILDGLRRMPRGEATEE